MDIDEDIEDIRDNNKLNITTKKSVKRSETVKLADSAMKTSLKPYFV